MSQGLPTPVGRFKIVLPFDAARCPTCDEPRRPGICPDCGTDIPEVEPGELERARQKALAPLASEAEDLAASFESPPESEVKLSVDQFVACFVDLHIVAKAGEFAPLGNDLAALNFDDPSVAGGVARRTVGDYLERVRRLRDDLWELARFDAEGPGVELRDLAFEIGRWAGEVLTTFLRTVSTLSIGEASKGSAAIQKLLDDSPFGERFDRVVSQLSDWMTPDDDARVSVALGREGSYTDDNGQLLLNAVVGAFADEPEPYKALGAAATRYFDRVIGLGAADGNASALLVVPAATMATLDRPLFAHRLVRLTHDLIARAIAVDRSAVEAAAGSAAEQAPLILAAASRIQKEFRLLAKVAVDDVVDDEHAELLEASYRTLGAFALSLDRIARGKKATTTDEPPMLRNLVDQLAASEEPALRVFACVADVPLRDSKAHSPYRWDGESGEIRDLKTGQAWSWEDFDLTIHALVSALAGVDAASACLVVREDFDLRPSWLGGADGDDATMLIATLSFGAHGFGVTRVEDGGTAVVIDRPIAIDPARLVPPLAGMTTIAKDRQRYVVRTDDGEELIAIDGALLLRATRAQPELMDLAIQEVTLNAMVNSGREPTEALLEVATLQAKVIAVTAMQELAEDLDHDASLERLGRRVAYLEALVKPHQEDRREFDRLLGKLERLAVSAMTATDGPDEWRRLCDQLTGLIGWADKRGISWPPRFGRD